MVGIMGAMLPKLRPFFWYLGLPMGHHVNYSMIGQIKSISQKCQIISESDFRYVGLQGGPFGGSWNRKNKIPPPPPQKKNDMSPKKGTIFHGKYIIQPLILKKTFGRFPGRKKNIIESTWKTETLHTYTTKTMGETHLWSNPQPANLSGSKPARCGRSWACEGGTAPCGAFLGHGSGDESSIVSIWMFPQK